MQKINSENQFYNKIIKQQEQFKRAKQKLIATSTLNITDIDKENCNYYILCIIKFI